MAEVRRFLPFPEGDSPDGWPTVYVAAEDYDRLEAALRAVRDYDPSKEGGIAAIGLVPRENPTTEAMRRIAREALADD